MTRAETIDRAVRRALTIGTPGGWATYPRGAATIIAAPWRQTHVVWQCADGAYAVRTEGPGEYESTYARSELTAILRDLCARVAPQDLHVQCAECGAVAHAVAPYGAPTLITRCPCGAETNHDLDWEIL